MESIAPEKLELLKQFIEPDTLDAAACLAAGCTYEQALEAGRCIARDFGDMQLYQLIADHRCADAAVEQHFITSFHNNLNLLIEKTWVEKTDEARKSLVQYRLSKVYEQLQHGDYVNSYDELLTILYDAVFLMFGGDAREPEFLEYALRIDPQFGVFWWFLYSMSEQPVWEDGVFRVVSLLFMLFIANY